MIVWLRVFCCMGLYGMEGGREFTREILKMDFGIGTAYARIYSQGGDKKG